MNYNDPYFAYIAAAYGITFLILGLIIIRSICVYHAVKKQMDNDHETAS